MSCVQQRSSLLSFCWWTLGLSRLFPSLEPILAYGRIQPLFRKTLESVCLKEISLVGGLNGCRKLMYCTGLGVWFWISGVWNLAAKLFQAIFWKLIILRQVMTQEWWQRFRGEKKLKTQERDKRGLIIYKLVLCLVRKTHKIFHLLLLLKILTHHFISNNKKSGNQTNSSGLCRYI